ncbi:MAG: T9SS type A sorting domain-containing protein [Taibaiella sp.]|jgi:hypothetical protein
MKRNFYFNIVTFVIALCPVYLSAQENPYSYQFSYTTNVVYTPLENNAVELIGATGWDDEVAPFTLPFDFYYKGALVQNWTMDTYGGLYPTNKYTAREIPPIAAFYSDYVDRGDSWIGYEVTGNTGSRIAKVEFKNVGYFSDVQKNDYANFQIWLYEGSNKIEYHAGSSSITKGHFNVTGEYGDLIITGLNYTDYNNDIQPAADVFHFVGRLNNAPKDSVVTLANNLGSADPAMINFINYGTFPESGTVFIFTPSASHAPLAVVETPEENTHILFPNPVTDKLTIHLNQSPDNGAVFMLHDMAGRELLRNNIKLQKTIIPVSFLTNGIYMGTIITRGKKETLRIIKQ